MVRRSLPAIAAIAAATCLVPGPAGADGRPAPAASLVEPQQRGGVGTWTKISGANPVTSAAVAGVARAVDGELVVAFPSEDGAGKSVRSVRLSASGAIVDQTRADGGYDIMNRFVSLSSDAAPWVHLAYAPYLSTPGNPYSDGGVHALGFDASTDSWSTILAPLVTDSVSNSATGLSSVVLDDTTRVTAVTVGSDVRYASGFSGAVSSFSQSHCCAYYATVVDDGVNAAVAWQGNGGTSDSTGVFARQIYSGLGTIYHAPRSATFTGSSYAASMSDQPTAAVQRNDGFTYLAYPYGYPSRAGVALWRASAPSAKLITAGKDARLVALANAAGGKMWLAWSIPGDKIKLVRTSATGVQLGGIRTISKPAAATGVFQIALEGSNNAVDVVVNGGNGFFHTRVLPGLNTSASPTRWPSGTTKRVVFTVKDAGVAISGARVSAKGRSCTTSVAGTCAITFPARSRGTFAASVTTSGYAKASVKLTVT